MAYGKTVTIYFDNGTPKTKSCPAAISKKRKNAVESALLKDWVTTEAMLFSSSSAAAAFSLGYAYNGPKNWKNSEGISVGELRKNPL